MFIVIKYATDFTTTKGAAVLKLATCEQCRAEYGYVVERYASGTDRSYFSFDDEGASVRSAERADEALEMRLAHAIEPVPCPACGWYQADMVARLRGRHLLWMAYLGAALIGGAVILGIVALVVAEHAGPRGSPALGILAMAVIGALAGVTLIAIRVVSANKLAPNATDLSERVRLGQSLAILREDIDMAAGPSAPRPRVRRRLPQRRDPDDDEDERGSS